MCRYTQNYYTGKSVCLTCKTACRTDVCVKCKNATVWVGKDFATPKKSDKQGWEAVRATLLAGYNYDSCGCTGPGWRPKNRSELREAPWRIPAKKGRFWLKKDQLK